MGEDYGLTDSCRYRVYVENRNTKFFYIMENIADIIFKTEKGRNI